MNDMPAFYIGAGRSTKYAICKAPPGNRSYFFINMAIRLQLVCYRLAKSGASRIPLAKRPYS